MEDSKVSHMIYQLVTSGALSDQHSLQSGNRIIIQRDVLVVIED
jgi:hypothetical protein